jgi:hypothetical protein
MVWLLQPTPFPFNLKTLQSTIEMRIGDLVLKFDLKKKNTYHLRKHNLKKYTRVARGVFTKPKTMQGNKSIGLLFCKFFLRFKLRSKNITIPFLMLISFTKVISLAWMRTWCFHWINKISFETNLVLFYITPFHYFTLVDALKKKIIHEIKMT